MKLIEYFLCSYDKEDYLLFARAKLLLIFQLVLFFGVFLLQFSMLFAGWEDFIKTIFIIFLLFGIIYISLLIKEENLLSKEIEKIKEDEKIALQLEQEKKEKDKLDAQRIILIEVEKVVDLIGQNNINDIKIIKNKIVYVIKPNTNIDAITIRYGAFALTKKSFKEIVVVVDLEHILKGKLL